MNYIILLALVLFTGCSSISEDKIFMYEKDDFAMGTIIRQKIYLNEENQELADTILNEVILKINDLEKLFDPKLETSDIYKINNTILVNDPPVVSSYTIDIINRSLYFSELTNGAFDISLGKIIDVWKINEGNKIVPSKEVIDSLLVNEGYTNIKVNNRRKTVRLNANIDLAIGAIAKGYAGDEVIKIYKKYNVTSAFINLGGNVVLFGDKNGDSWKVGIQNPRLPQGNYIGVLTLENKSVVTSGDYERYFESESIRYHHIIDPENGFPSRSGLISSTIISEDSTMADALSTAVFVLGYEKGRALIDSIESVEAIFITDTKEIYVTDGIQNNFELKPTDEGYQIK